METELDMKLTQQPKSFSVNDPNGQSRTFHVQVRLDPIGIFMEAEEEVDNGYAFSVHGERVCNQAELFAKLVDKVRRGIETKYVTDLHTPDGYKIQAIKDDQVVGRLDYDKWNEDGPLTVIDGRPYTWEQLGRLVRQFEGFQFQIKFFDVTDEVE
ncbi:hypothetical protein PU629_03465 [Pullulanibacillus sp. KACC 23026]|uniref:DUF7686 domain-containing protein n=1 Tax=Pullulanibacillus sp. KACC 23026 TaxID=3028315 RepID=UPI0023B0B934|nr:hypothetical protein [Pullulanibacillus sp. KACC 23026]WEG13440.1 hypothetical protein PU629_03465 [Pullulanibacillus sp. KACC 23026]